jgi:hypothetical protein
MDSRTITNILGRHLFEKGHTPIVSNFRTDTLQECDLISFTKLNYAYEYEVKVSVSDFKADFKKTAKHKLMCNGKGVTRYKGKVKYKVCNYFSYVTPAALVTEDMVPSYAGLIWVYNDGMVRVIRKAPKIHDTPAGDDILRKVAHNLTQKHLFGSAYATMVRKEKTKKPERKLLSRRKNNGK